MSTAGPKVLDENELARMVQAKFPALCRITLRIDSSFTALGLAGSAKDLIRCGFCSSRMIARLPPSGFKYYGRKHWPHRATIRRLRNGFRLETTYHWQSVNREEITAALGLPPGVLLRSVPLRPQEQLLPTRARAMAKTYPGLRIEGVRWGSYHDGQMRQLITFVGSKAEIIRASLLTGEALMRIEAGQKRGQLVYTEYGGFNIG
jgi:hypothetical protein